MDQQEYLANLKSPDIRRRRKALDSDYRPCSAKEIKLVIDATLIAKPDLHSKLLEHLKEVSFEIALPAYLELALRAQPPAVRLSALQLLENSQQPEVDRALFTAAFDRNYQVEEAAINALGKRARTDEITGLLLDRIGDPVAEISDEKEKGADVIKRTAIKNLGAAGAEEVIVPLINIALTEPQYRDEVEASLVRVNSEQVAQILLDIVDGIPQPDILGDAMQQPVLDGALELFIARTILPIPLTQELIVRFRSFYCRLYSQEIVRHKTFLSGSLNEVFAPEIGECIVRLLAEHCGNPEVVVRLTEDLATLSVRSSFSYWLMFLDRSEPHVIKGSQETLITLVQSDITTFTRLLSESLVSGKRPAHEPGHMLDIISHFPEHAITFSDSIIPLVRNSGENSTGVALSYLDAIWKMAAADTFPDLLHSLLGLGYLKHPDGRDSLAQFLKKYWDHGHEQWRDTMYRCLIEMRSKQRTAKVIRELIIWLMENVESPGKMIALAVSDMVDLTAQDKMWLILDELLQHAPPGLVWQQVSTQIKAKWHRDLIELLYSRDPQNLGELCRLILLNPEQYPMDDQDWVRIITILGELALPEDRNLFAGFISPDFSTATQIAGIGALSNQPDTTTASAMLTRALKNQDSSVVDEAINCLRRMGVPTIELVQALQERTSSNYESDATIRANADNALRAITERHLATPPSRQSTDDDFYRWLAIVDEIGVCDCEAILSDLFAQHSPLEFVNRRAAIVRTISKATNPDQGKQILESAMVNEREPVVRDAMRSALDELGGHPDRADFNLVSQVINRTFDQDSLLGKWHLDQLFSQSRTIVVFRQLLREAIEVAKNNDAFVERLDSISDALIRDVFSADGARLDPDGKIPEDAHESRINRLQTLYPDMSLAAGRIHELRKLKAKGPHPYDPSGAPRFGVDDNARHYAEDDFALLIEEVIKVLRRITEVSP